MTVLSPLSSFYCKISSPNEDKPRNPSSIGFNKKPPPSSSSSSSSSSANGILCKTAPFAAASLAILLFSTPAQAGILSGFPGIESVPGPELPQIDFLNRFNGAIFLPFIQEENQKKYAEFDQRFKSSPLLQQLLEKSKLNREKNRQEIQDKYCLRGAEWGVGDCSTEGMSPEDRDSFIAMLKKKTGEQ